MGKELKYNKKTQGIAGSRNMIVRGMSVHRETSFKQDVLCIHPVREDGGVSPAMKLEIPMEHVNEFISILSSFN